MASKFWAQESGASGSESDSDSDSDSSMGGAGGAAGARRQWAVDSDSESEEEVCARVAYMCVPYLECVMLLLPANESGQECL